MLSVFREMRKTIFIVFCSLKYFFYSSIGSNVVIVNRAFSKTVKPHLPEKVTKHFKMNLVEYDQIISRDD